MKFLLFIIAFSSEIALSYPENIRNGYTNCTSCHVSPTGGGAVTSYGRSFSAEVLSTWKKQGEENYFLPALPEGVSYGGNARYVNLSIDSCGYSYSRKFLMQADAELALEVLPGLIVAGTYGVYNVDTKYRKPLLYEQRRNYVLINASDNLSLRAGRFFPAYGIHFADHTLATRSAIGFGQGEETFNVEASYKNQYFELFTTGVQGKTGSVSIDGSKGYKWTGDGEEHGLIGRLALNFQTYQIGVSALRMIGVNRVRSSYGAYANLGLFESLYLQLQADKIFSGSTPQLVGTGKIGFVPIRGVHLITSYDTLDKDYTSWHWGVTLYPRPHWEFNAEFIRKNADRRYDEMLFITNHYL